MTEAQRLPESGLARIAFTDAGAGHPVVLLHGFLFDRSMWRSQIRALVDRGLRAIAIDLPGFGESEPPTAPATMAAYSSAVARVLDHLGIDRITLVGYSMGGQVAMDLCAARPALVERLVLIDTVAHVDPPEIAQGRRDLADRLEREGVADYAEEFLPQLLHLEAAQQEAVEHARAMMRASSPTGAALALRARADRPAYEPVLDACASPALVIVGEHDPFDQGRFGAAMADRLPAGALARIAGVGHTPPLEAPEELSRLLAGFLER